MQVPVLEVSGLSISFTQYGRGLRQVETEVIRALSLSIHAGEIVAVVGASGSGKSLLAHAILGLLPSNARTTGQLLFDGKQLTPSTIKKLRGSQIGFIPQSVQSLDPLMRVGEQVRQSVRIGVPAEQQERAFRRYGLAPKTAKRYPFELSGGMSRRVLVSMASVTGARLLVADEPTPGLDEAVIQETLDSFQAFAAEGAAILFITHDLGVAAAIADRVAVFHEGRTVAIEQAADFTGDGGRLTHAYSRALWLALPQNEFMVRGDYAT